MKERRTKTFINEKRKGKNRRSRKNKKKLTGNSKEHSAEKSKEIKNGKTKEKINLKSNEEKSIKYVRKSIEYGTSTTSMDTNKTKEELELEVEKKAYNMRKKECRHIIEEKKLQILKEFSLYFHIIKFIFI